MAIPTPTQLTRDAKAAIQLVFEDLGGVPRLLEWCNDDPRNLTAFYTQIWPRIVPKDIKSEVTGKDGKDLVIQMVRFADYDQESQVDGANLITE